MSKTTEKCWRWRCRGDGSYWRVPIGFNPFNAGARSTAQAAERVRCFKCGGTGKLARAKSAEPED